MAKITNLEQLKKAVEGTGFERDMTTSMSVNGNPMPHGVWNLLCSIRDCKLFTKGMKIHRHWRITDVKVYFGVKGSPEKVVEALENYKNILMPKAEAEA